MSDSKFSSLSLQPAILDNLSSLGYHEMTEIQAKSLPAILAGQDVIAQGKTGSGKTAAFGLGLLNKLQVKKFRIQTLVLCPTRELADQVAKEIRKLARAVHNIKVLTLCGGTPFGPQVGSLEHGAHIIVGTPGRIEDHLGRGTLSLDHVDTLVLDEADRMLDMGFITDMQTVISGCSDDRQILLFSATFPAAIKQFASKVLKQAEIVRVDQTNSTADTVHHVVYPVEERRKQELLSELIGKKNWQQVLVFVNMKDTADELVKELNLDGIPAAVCHGDKTQGNRRRALRDFKEGKVRVLVATEVAARGIDIDGLPRVINIDLPWLAEDYVHRIGRTGRAGNQGQAISFVSREEENMLFEIETLIGQKIKREYLSGYEVSNREVLIDKIGKKPSHLRRSRANKPSGQATGEARAKNRSRISGVRKSLKGEKLTLKK